MICKIRRVHTCRSNTAPQCTEMRGSEYRDTGSDHRVVHPSTRIVCCLYSQAVLPFTTCHTMLQRLQVAGCAGTHTQRPLSQSVCSHSTTRMKHIARTTVGRRQVATDPKTVPAGPAERVRHAPRDPSTQAMFLAGGTVLRPNLCYLTSGR